MIFLKKFSAAVILAAILTILSGCSVGAADNSGDGSSAETTIATIEPVTAEPLPDVSSLAPAESSYVYDYANVLTAGQTAGINSYCEKLYKERYTFAGGAFFERMKELDLYTTDAAAVSERVKANRLYGIFA